MKGRILDYSVQTNSGLIAGDDGSRYSFVGPEWKDQAIPYRGMQVDFEAQGSDAVAIYRDVTTSDTGGIGGATGSEKTRLIAGLLGIFLGWVGAHKFYLGIARPARIQAIVGGAGFVLLFILSPVLMTTPISFTSELRDWSLLFNTVGRLAFAGMLIIGLIEGIMYLTNSDEDFEQVYVVGKKEWF